jgi:ketol-acid reductoisomerase
MAARRAPRALCSSIAQLTKPSVAGRAFTPLLAARAAAPVAQRYVAASFQQTRGIKTIDFAGTKEKVYGKYTESHVVFRG